MKSRLLGIFIASVILAFSSPQPVNAAFFTISFFELTGTRLDGDNFFDDYTLAGVGTFEIMDSAVTSNNLVMFSDPAFISFELSITLSTLNSNNIPDSSTFTLGVDDFEVGESAERGLLFDGSGAPLRFDRPNTTFSNAASMCDPTCEIAIGSKASLSLFDDDTYDVVYLANGDITSQTVIMNTMPGTPFTPFHGDWSYLKGVPGVGGSGSLTSGRYILNAVPIPATVWLFGSGLLGLVGIARHKKA